MRESDSKLEPPEVPVPFDRPSPRDVAKFTALVALSSIFIDAVLGHGLLWENDPYWTYWITKTFLIATIFGLGTAWVGIGLGRGAGITAVHTLVLTIYYWSLSPIGVPSSPVWLDLEHTWVTGVPVHFAVIYGGYLLALWIWNRRGLEAQDQPTSAFALRTLGLAVLVVAVAGTASMIVTLNFPGATWFVVRLLITATFLLGWRAVAGRDSLAAVIGGLMLALVWAAYAQFLGPSGLPDLPLRIVDPSPPGATSHWESYRDIWLLTLPIHAILMSAILLFDAGPPKEPQSFRFLLGPAALGALLIGSGLIFPHLYRPAEATVSASGPARLEVGKWFSGSFEDVDASVEVLARDSGGDRVSPLPPHDLVDLSATVQTSEGTWTVTAQTPMVSDPAGRFSTWWGVGIDAEHHGRSGIGSDEIPSVKSPIAVFALGSVEIEGEPVANNVPIHFMTSEEPMNGAKAELDVGDPDLEPVVGLPGGHLRILWSEYSGEVSQEGHLARYVLGSLVLLLFVVTGVVVVLMGPLEESASRP